MTEKITDLLPGEILTGFTNEQIAAINRAIKNKNPILFTGKNTRGKTTSAWLLRRGGIIAYAPEDICIVNLDEKEVDYRA
jgi:hypothetical protein